MTISSPGPARSVKKSLSLGTRLPNGQIWSHLQHACQIRNSSRGLDPDARAFVGLFYPRAVKQTGLVTPTPISWCLSLKKKKINQRSGKFFCALIYSVFMSASEEYIRARINWCDRSALSLPPASMLLPILYPLSGKIASKREQDTPFTDKLAVDPILSRRIG